MKRFLAAYPAVLCALYAFLPACCAAAAAGGYVFSLRCGEGVLAVQTAALLLFALLLFRSGCPLGRAPAALCALLPLLAIVNGLCFLGTAQEGLALALLLVNGGCAVAVLAGFVRPRGLKTVFAALTALLVLLLLLLLAFLSFFRMTFGLLLPEETTVREIPSPGGRYIAEVAARDQGAMGGDTLVNVREPQRDVDLLVGRLIRPSVRVYVGDWGEAETLSVCWKDERTLFIGGAEYAVEGLG
ncbi:MAG TPA: hypothetical protein H9684_10790 [Firmicutes bacterium]|nr:hypothetical protein [Bacillota bacterium]